MAKTYDKVRYIETSGFNPHYNLAVESALMDAAKDGELIVYLWRNDNTVVIGRHQNAYLDVNIKKLHDAGGCLARRPTGGGAVFQQMRCFAPFFAAFFVKKVLAALSVPGV